jgi:hypothetical protein
MDASGMGMSKLGVTLTESLGVLMGISWEPSEASSRRSA